MTTYTNTRNGNLAELIEKTEAGAVMKMLDSGETVNIGIPTLKRWWKLVPETEETAPAGATGESETPDEKTDSQNAPVEPQIKDEANNTSETENSATETVGPPVKLSEIVAKLESLFDLLNGLYFEKKLPHPVITIQSTPKAYGHCSTKKIWKSETEGQYEINIGAEFLNRPTENTAATLLHEMIHLYCRENEIEETCQKGRYHNKTFKIEAESRGLQIDYDRAIGYSITSPTEDFTQKLRDAGFDMTVPFARHTQIAKKTSDREKAHKYVCPLCGQTVRSTGELSLICSVCEVPMARED